MFKTIKESIVKSYKMYKSNLSTFLKVLLTLFIAFILISLVHISFSVVGEGATLENIGMIIMGIVYFIVGLISTYVLFVAGAYVIQLKQKGKRLSLSQAWDEVDKKTGKLIGLNVNGKYYWMYTNYIYGTGKFTSIKGCDKGLFVNGIPVFLSKVRELTDTDIYAFIVNMQSNHIFTEGYMVSDYLNAYPNVVTMLKKKNPIIFNHIKLIIQNYGPYTALVSKEVFEKLFDETVWPCYDSTGYSPIQVAKAKYIWWRDKGNFDKATEYAEKYNQLKEADKSIG